VLEFRKLVSPFGTPTEKNWQFFEHEGELFCMYSIAPYVIGRVSGTTLELVINEPAPFDWPFGVPHGGTPPVRVNDEYFTFFHSDLTLSSRRVYVAGVLSFEARRPFRITGYHPEPVMRAGKDNRDHARLYVVYPGGAIFEDGLWQIAYGWHDMKCKLLRLPHSVVLKGFHRFDTGRLASTVEETQP